MKGDPTMFGTSKNQPNVQTPAPAAAPQRAVLDVKDVLVEGEQLLHTINTDQRDIAITNRRVLLLESRGSYSAIPLGKIDTIEVSDRGSEPGNFVKLFFGGGLSRTLGVPTAEDARKMAALGS